MGQSSSQEPSGADRSHEDIARELANRFAEKCFTSLELYSFKDTFKSLADEQDAIRYLKEDTITRFLEIPDVLGVSPVIYQMLTYIGAFPFLQDAPAVLGLEQMVMVVVIMSDRYKRVLAKGSTDRFKLFFKSLAVFDRRLAKEDADDGASQKKGASGTAPLGFAVDAPVDDMEDVDADLGVLDDEDDDLILASFELLDMNDAMRRGDAPQTGGAMIPADNFRRLIMLLLLIAPIGPLEHLSQYSDHLVGDDLENLRSTAENILAAFLDVETSPGICYNRFLRVAPVCFPFLFQGFNALFEHFLFSKNLDLSRYKDEDKDRARHPIEIVQPLLQDTGDIMSLSVLSQLSFFIPGTDLFRRVRLLYSGSNDGFSMGSFESKVFNWRAPTLLLVSGSRIEDSPQNGQEASFAASLPPKRFPHGSRSNRVTYGVYISQPWKHTHKECFGEPDTTLFQLEPIHDVFPASTLNRDYVAFTKAPANRPLMSFGCPHPRPTKSQRHAEVVSLGSVSLLIDSSFEFGVFNHDYAARGGAFANSVIRRNNFQDRFEIESLEVWGCGGDQEAKVQAERWAWEAREAEARRRINLGTGDIEADRALLEMAGLVGGGRSGGSIA